VDADTQAVGVVLMQEAGAETGWEARASVDSGIRKSVYSRLWLACMGDRQLAPRVTKSERLSKHGPCPFRGKLNDGPSRIGLAASNGALIWDHPGCEWFGSSLGALREIALISHHPVYIFRASRAMDGKG
jgi:hypothetical protein